jgi:hypothetical protein
MNRPLSPQIRRLAQRLLAYEGGAGLPSRLAAARVTEKLSRPLKTLVGIAGFRSLLSRALALASTEVAWMTAVNVSKDGRLEGFDEVNARISNGELAKGEVIFISHLIGLLVTFIGEALALVLVRDAWPKEAFEDFVEAKDL